MKVFTVICPTFLPTAVPSTVEAHTKKVNNVYSSIHAKCMNKWTWTNGPNGLNMSKWTKPTWNLSKRTNFGLKWTWANGPTLV